MNNKQRCVILCGFLVILLIGLFPPWLVPSRPHGPTGPLAWEPEEYNTYRIWGRSPRIVFSRPDEGGYYFRVNNLRLLVEWFLVSWITGVVVTFLGDRPQRPAQKPDD